MSIRQTFVDIDEGETSTEQPVRALSGKILGSVPSTIHEISVKFQNED